LYFIILIIHNFS